MLDFSNAFNTLPTSESLAQRKATKMSFIKKENEELKRYASEVKSSLMNYKGIISELISEKSCVENSNRDETQSIISNRISDMLLSEKKELEKRIRKARKDIFESLERAKESEKMANYWLKKEENLVRSYEIKIKGCLAVSIEKEKIIEQEVTKRNEMERNLNEFFAMRENEITKEEQCALLLRKREGYCKIINQLNKNYEKVKLDCEALEKRNERLYEEYKDMKNLLTSKSIILISQYSTQLQKDFQKCKNLNLEQTVCNEKAREEPELNYEQELKNKLKILGKKLLRHQLKLQSVSEEISRQQVKRSELLTDQKHLQEISSAYISEISYYSDADKENQYPLSPSSKMNPESFQNDDIEKTCNGQSILAELGEISI
ncbi:unnamed protein product [Blepharisma stoltei]|uniref:Coiled-coil domain-containing protein 172 n=1 Tax=Blepharisma stoltei TaxID=1481888 RepID=A0AAU9KCN5_9CILI|nr:unnamed protein product [Blepharisma stoltei]